MPRDGASIRPGASGAPLGYRRDREGGPRLKPSYWGCQLVSRILRYGQRAIKPPRFRHVIVALRSRVNSLAENKVDGRIPIPEQLLRGGRRTDRTASDDANGTEKEATGTSKARLRDETLPIADLEAQSIDDRDHSLAESGNMRSGGNRPRCRLTAWIKTQVSRCPGGRGCVAAESATSAHDRETTR